MKIEDLIENKLIKRISVTPERIQSSLKLAERFLERAKGNLKIGYFDTAFILAYMSMFHSARALLFKNGFMDRTHYGMIEALKEIYKKEVEIHQHLEILDSYRIARHGIQYSGDLCSKTDAEESIEDATRFLQVVKEILGS